MALLTYLSRHQPIALSWFEGNNEYGQLADGTTTQHLTPNLVAGSAPFKAIVSGPTAQHTLLMQVIMRVVPFSGWSAMPETSRAHICLHALSSLLSKALLSCTMPDSQMLCPVP